MFKFLDQKYFRFKRISWFWLKDTTPQCWTQAEGKLATMVMHHAPAGRFYIRLIHGNAWVHSYINTGGFNCSKKYLLLHWGCANNAHSLWSTSPWRGLRFTHAHIHTRRCKHTQNFRCPFPRNGHAVFHWTGARTFIKDLVSWWTVEVWTGSQEPLTALPASVHVFC